MGTYVFQCCNRTVTDPNINTTSASFAHLCLNDIPCIGAATLVGSAPLTDVQTEVVDPSTGQLMGIDGGTPTNGDGQ